MYPDTAVEDSPGDPGPRECLVTQCGGQASGGVACPCSGSHLQLSPVTFF